MSHDPHPTNPYGYPPQQGPQPGQPPAGYQPPPYPQQGYPAYPSYPQQPGYAMPPYQHTEPVPPAPERPGSVTAAFGLWILILLVSVASTLFLFTGGYYDLLGAAIEAQGLDGSQAAAALSIGRDFLIIAALIGLGIAAFIYLFFGGFMVAGRNWARIVLTVLGGLSVLSSVMGGATAQLDVSDLTVDMPGIAVALNWAAVLAALLAIILMYAPASNRYFAAVKARRKAGIK